MVETERKFLVNSKAFKEKVASKHHIIQGYLSAQAKRSVRVRITGSKGYLTIKGAALKNSFSRFEWEKEIPLKDAEALMQLCLPNKVEKTRYCIEFNGHLFEVDVFSGQNTGLIVAEIEVEYEEAHFDKPKWLGKEITGIKKYYNSQLCQNPFTKW